MSKFPTADIIGAQNNFNFASKISQNGGFSATNFAFLDENFKPIIWGGNLPLSCPALAGI